MAIKLSNKKMANFGLLLVLIGGIVVAIGGYIWNKFSSKSNRERHLEIMARGDSINKNVTNGVDEIKKQMTVNEHILITPAEIIIPAKFSRDVPIVITNNYSYPVFMVVLELKITEGELDLSTNFQLTPPGNGILKSKYISCQIPQINSKATANLLAKINGGKYLEASKIKLSIVGFLKEPTPDFTMDKMDSLPKTIQLPDGFIPPFQKNDTDH